MTITSQAAAPTTSPRDQLILEHVAMARRIARKIARRTPGQLEGDLASAALVGLTEAAARFDTGRGGSFIAFAAPRIRGAVIDELRRGDVLPRRVRHTANRHAQVVNELQHALGRKPDADEVAQALGVTVDAVRDEIAVSAQVCVLSMADATGAREVVDEADLASDSLEHAQLVRTVRDALARLPQRDALVLSLYYLEGLSYQQAGEVIGVSESRVCQLCGRAIKRLRALLGQEVI
jgi:RNA polymerase sigma factor FliA